MARRKLEVVLVGDSKSLEKALGRASGATTKGSKVIGDAAKLGAIAVGGLGIAAVNAAGDYEKSLNIFQAVSGATGKEMGKVSALAKKLGADIHLPGTSAKDAATAMTELAKGGLSVKDSMAAARGVLQLSAAAQIDNSEAATITARALNAFSLKGKEAGRVSDLLAATSNASTAEITDVAYALQQSAASAHQMGIPIQDLTAAIGEMANAGIVGSDAGTSLKTMFARLNPTTKAAGQEIKKLGIDVFDSHGKFIGVQGAIKQYHTALSKLNPKQRQTALNTIFGSDAQRAANIVLGAGVTKFDDMKKAVTKHGAAQDLAAAKTKGFKGSLEAFKSTVETLAITFGQTLLPAATSVMRFLSTAFGEFGSHKTLTLALVAAIGGLSAAIWTVNAATRAWNAGVAAWKVISKGSVVFTRAWAAAQWLLNAAMSANPIGIVVVAVAALVAGVIIAYKKSETFRKIVTAALDAVSGAARALARWVSKAFGDVVKWITTAWRNVKSATTAAWRAIKGTLTTVFSGIKTAIIAYFTAYKTVILGVWRGVRDTGRAIWSGIRTTLGAVWGAIKTVARAEWNGVKAAIINPIMAVRDRIHDIISTLKGWMAARWGEIKDAASTFATGLKDRIVGAFKSSVRAVAGFINSIIGIVNRIPGVDIGKINMKGLAQGGAYARTGGVVNRPIVMMGEEAPSHPEFVIPTNPAYRKRAKGLLAQAAGAIGFAQGGTFGFNQLQNLWLSAHGAPGDSKIAAAVALAESRGNPRAYNRSGASGLWQILGQVVPGNIFDPFVNALNAVKKFNAAHGWSPWVAYTSGAYKQFLTHHGGGLAGLLDPMQLIGKLPGVSKLGWLKGLGKYVLGRVGHWIKGQLFGGGVGSGPGPMTPNGLHANIVEAIRLAQKMGFAYPSPGQLTGGTHAPGSYHYQGRAVDFGYAGHSFGQMMALRQALVGHFGLRNIKEEFFDPASAYIKNGRWISGAFGGHGDHLHFAMRQGGVFGAPYVGAYEHGGVVPRDGMAMVHKGERISPAGRGGGTICLTANGDVHIGGRRTAEIALNRLSHKVAFA